MAIAGIGAMPGTITSRSIAIKMERKLPHERVARLTHRTGHDLNLICRKMARWVADNRSSLEAAEPAVPDQLGNRSADNWCELLGIAEAIGGEWPSRAREAAIARAGEDDGEVVAVQLLADIKEVFDTTGADKLLSSTIVDRLIEMEGRPWAEFGRARKPITPNAMARLLKPFKITPGSIRPDLQGRGTKGYERKAFEELWRRYLPEGGINPAQRHNQGNPPISEESQPAHAEPGVPDANRWKAAQSATCAVVPDRNPVPGQREEFDL
jgi:Protein of unknown function (DUF3631)